MMNGSEGNQVTDWAQVSHQQRVDRILDSVFWGGFTWAVIVAAVAVWLTVRLHSSYAAPGRLIVGGLAGAVAGVAGSAAHAVPSNIVSGEKLTPDQRHLLLIAGVALTGAIAGAMIGWLWGRRGSAGLAAGLLGGALCEAAVIGSGSSGRHDLVAKAGLGALVIVGFVALTQALLDASAERAPRALASSRGP
jgi:hypothetical protein